MGIQYHTRDTILNKSYAHSEGYVAGEHGANRDYNPYNNEPERSAWFRGWEQAEADYNKPDTDLHPIEVAASLLTWIIAGGLLAGFTYGVIYLLGYLFP